MPIKRVAKLITIAFLLLAQVAFSQNIKWNFRHSGSSNRDLLGIGEPVTRLAVGFSNTAPPNATPDTLRILAIRVDFQADNNPLTTGNGKFDLSPPSAEETVIDPPPHNRTYFEHQLLALSNYFRTVSNGKLSIEFEVFPNDLNGAFTVSQPMNFYSPPRDEELLDQRLSELFQEGFQLADAAGTIDFSQFDSFILFHAGVGLDFAFDFDPTPQDIPSVFLDFNTFKRYLGNNDPTYPGISVNNGQAFIRDGIILPETQNQEGFQIALLGTMAIMFGHQLGLPNLFNTETGRSGIGVFGLMDQGSGNFSGLLPAEPCAWSKLFLGWETAIEIRDGQNLSVAAPQSANPNKIYKIPINSEEYFLIENRLRDFNDDNVAIGRDASGNRVEFRWDDQGQRLVTDGPIGVVTQVNEYDFGLPGSGILIWHIDERIIRANFAANRVNADPENRGVDLEEADGAQDIGQLYGFFSPGAGSENGVAEDMFWGSNPINKLVNDSSAVVAFTPITTPSSLSNSGANTHIFITDFSEPGEVMTFTVREEFSRSGFPQLVSSAATLTNSPITADLNGDGAKEIIWSSNIGTRVFVWNANGTKFIPNPDVGEIQNVNGEILSLPLAVFAEPPGTFSFSPAVARLGNRSAVVVATDAAVAAYLPEDTNADGRADELFVFQNGETFSTPPMVMEVVDVSNPFNIIVGTKSGYIYTIPPSGIGSLLLNTRSQAISGLALLPSARIAFTTQDGLIGVISFTASGVIWQNATHNAISTAPVIGDLNQDGKLNVIAVTDNGTVYVFEENGDLTPGFSRSTNIEPSSQVALADLDKDAFLEMVFVADNQIYAFNRVGFLLNDFPIKISSSNSSERILSSPILADLDGDSAPEILVGSNARQLAAYHRNGKMVPDFPLSTGAAVNSTAAVSDLDNDGDMEIAAVADDGFLYVWDLDAAFVPANIPWGNFLADARHTNANLVVNTPPSPQGRLLLPNLVYNYPNPTEGSQTTIRYRLNFSAQSVRIRIFDLAGELVDELSGPGFAQADNEVNWPLNNIESGVYLARVEAQGNGLKDVVTFKIAVIK